MTSEPERIAAGLSEAQRRYLTTDMRDISNPRVWFLYGEIATDKRMIPTRTVLTRKGLMEDGRFGPTMLTLLGLAVRAILENDRG